MPNFDHFSQSLHQLRKQHRFRELVPRQPDGLAFDQSGRRLINFGTNDYLGLALRQNIIDPRGVSSSASGIGSAAIGAGASALVCGWTDQHQQLAESIAQFEETESAVIFPSGFAACSGTVATLAGPNDLILSDQLNHASLIDGCRWSKAQRVVFPHRDTAAVERVLSENVNKFDHIWIVTESVFSMDGHVAPMTALVELADRFDAYLIVDEAHATGVLGEDGSGACQAAGVKNRVPIRVGTLSKAIGVQGGFVAGPRVVIEYLVNRCRSLIYSTSLSPLCVSAAIDSISMIKSEPHRRDRVTKLASHLRQSLGITTDTPTENLVPIVPMILGDEARTLAISASLRERGFYIPAIRPPTVGEGSSRLRISLSFGHTDDMIDGLISALQELSLC